MSAVRHKVCGTTGKGEARLLMSKRRSRSKVRMLRRECLGGRLVRHNGSLFFGGGGDGPVRVPGAL